MEIGVHGLLRGSTEHIPIKGLRNGLFHALSAYITDHHRPGSWYTMNIYFSTESATNNLPSYHHGKGAVQVTTRGKKHACPTVVTSSPSLDLRCLFSGVQE